jgi:phosphoadenosine phosphosulfate reductase
VFFEELDLLGFQGYWFYPPAEQPLLWASGRQYFHHGELVATVSGGGFYETQRLEVRREGLILTPIAVDAMMGKNRRLLDGMAHTALEFIQEKHAEYRRKVDIAAVAFSGGKDSLVLLDLVQRVLAPDDYVVVFGDTSMELAATHEAVQAARERWPNLTFYTARAPKPALVTWQEFGPPSRLHRWCCTVHKSAPTLLLLRSLIRSPVIRALVFDGIRYDESQRRAGYLPVSEGTKHITQINASPLLTWNAGAVFLYLFDRGLFMNRAYRCGLARVGCAVCPFASQWANLICRLAFQGDVAVFLELLEGYASGKGIRGTAERRRFINDRHWGSRAGGRELDAKPRVFCENGGDTVTFLIRHPRENWLEWARTLGELVRDGPDGGMIGNGLVSYPFHIKRQAHGLEIVVTDCDRADAIFLSRLRAVANKTAYCVHCRGCEVECPSGALRIRDVVQVDAERCVHCGRCLLFTDKGCLAAKSLAITRGDHVKGLNRYQQFGMRKEWVDAYLKNPDGWWLAHNLGNRQFEAMRVWLQEAELISERKLTPAGAVLQRLGVNNPLTWAFIWTNLARNSALVGWYVQHVGWSGTWTKKGLMALMGDSLSRRTRENAVDTLVELLGKTPLGEDLRLGQMEIKGRQVISVTKGVWADPHPLAILYALYRLSERLGRYNLTVSELFDPLPEGPHALFGITREPMSRYLQGLAMRWPEWIEAELVRDLDNVYLKKQYHSTEVLNLVHSK